jgi:predicted DNA-binding transcriptional regulator AlpA
MSKSPDPTVLDDPLLFEAEVEVLVRMSRQTIWRKRKRSEFQEPIVVGGKNAWFRSQIISYMESLRTSGRTIPEPKWATKARRDAARRRRAQRHPRDAHSARVATL